MKKLDIWHHKLIVMLIMLAIFIGGILFGVRLNASTLGTGGMEITMFAMLLVGVSISYITFMQVIHLRDDIELKGRRR